MQLSRQSYERWSPSRISRPSPSKECTRWQPLPSENSKAKAQLWWTWSKKRKHSRRMRPTTSPPSINQGPDPKQTKPVVQTKEIITPDEEDPKQDQDEEETTKLEIMGTGTANIATAANFKGTNKKIAQEENERWQTLLRHPRTILLAKDLFHGRKRSQASQFNWSGSRSNFKNRVPLRF